jgi:hypothetical protein
VSHAQDMEMQQSPEIIAQFYEIEDIPDKYDRTPLKK